MKQLSKHTRTRLIMVNGHKVRAHRAIMENYLGRKLEADEDVHHINRNPLDNRIDNLEVKTKDEHCKLHALEKQKYPDFKLCENCGKEFKVNPRKRKRNKCCSPECAMAFRIRGRQEQNRKSPSKSSRQ